MAKITSKRSERRTTAELDELAHRFEEDFGPRDFKPRRSGRPPLGDDFPSPRIQVRVPRQLYQAVSKKARDQGTTVSAFVRRLLEKNAS